MRKLSIILIFISLVACQEDSQDEVVPFNQQEALLTIPEGFPEMEFPEGNELTIARWELGKKLFYEKRLSIDNSLSCVMSLKCSKNKIYVFMFVKLFENNFQITCTLT